MVYDVCRTILLAIGVDKIHFHQVKEGCTKLMEKYGNNPRNWPCREHKAIMSDADHPYCF